MHHVNEPESRSFINSIIRQRSGRHALKLPCLRGQTLRLVLLRRFHAACVHYFKALSEVRQLTLVKK